MRVVLELAGLRDLVDLPSLDVDDSTAENEVGVIHT